MRCVALLTCAMISLLILIGCQAGAPGTGDVEGAPVMSSFDPCADRLHQISGHILLFHLLRNRLPRDIEELNEFLLARGEQTPLQCPQSGRQYIYSDEGLPIDQPPGRVILYDAEPAHDGLRWGILKKPRHGDQPLLFDVILVPEEIVP